MLLFVALLFVACAFGMTEQAETARPAKGVRASGQGDPPSLALPRSRRQAPGNLICIKFRARIGV
jgi:hypothetical protein